MGQLITRMSRFDGKYQFIDIGRPHVFCGNVFDGGTHCLERRLMTAQTARFHCSRLIGAR